MGNFVKRRRCADAIVRSAPQKTATDHANNLNIFLRCYETETVDETAFPGPLWHIQSSNLSKSVGPLNNFIENVIIAERRNKLRTLVSTAPNRDRDRSTEPRSLLPVHP